MKHRGICRLGLPFQTFNFCEEMVFFHVRGALAADLDLDFFLQDPGACVIVNGGNVGQSQRGQNG